MTEREDFTLAWPLDAVRLDEQRGCVTVTLDRGQLAALVEILEGALAGMEPTMLPVRGSG